MKAQQPPCYNMALTSNATLFILLAMALLPASHAQSNAPVTGRMAQPVPAAVATTTGQQNVPVASTAPPAAMQPAPVAEEAIARTRIGDVTHTLLQAQADGRVAGPRLPMLGVTADASWQRYLESFRHPLPEYFENKVAKSQSN